MGRERLKEEILPENTQPPRPEPIRINLSDELRLNEEIAARGRGPETDGVRVVSSDDWSASADLHGGVGVSSTDGRPSLNEDLTIRTVLMLARYLSNKGAELGGVEFVQEEAADCKILTSDPKRPLLVQVVRAETLGKFWAELSRSRVAIRPRIGLGDLSLASSVFCATHRSLGRIRLYKDSMLHKRFLVEPTKLVYKGSRTWQKVLLVRD